jgi:hypothetical protein
VDLAARVQGLADRLAHAGGDFDRPGQARPPVADDHQPGIVAHAVVLGRSRIERGVARGQAFQHAARDGEVPVRVVGGERARRDAQQALDLADDLGPEAGGPTPVGDAFLLQRLLDAALHHADHGGPGQVGNAGGRAAR